MTTHKANRLPKVKIPVSWDKMQFRLVPRCKHFRTTSYLRLQVIPKHYPDDGNKKLLRNVHISGIIFARHEGLQDTVGTTPHILSLGNRWSRSRSGRLFTPRVGIQWTEGRVGRSGCCGEEKPLLLLQGIERRFLGRLPRSIVTVSTTLSWPT
jgi:hypothetical protein